MYIPSTDTSIHTLKTSHQTFIDVSAACLFLLFYSIKEISNCILCLDTDTVKSCMTSENVKRHQKTEKLMLLIIFQFEYFICTLH